MVVDGDSVIHQVMTSASNLGARELLATQMQMFEDVSGVSRAQ